MKVIRIHDKWKKSLIIVISIIIFIWSLLCFNIESTGAHTNKTIWEIDRFIQSKMEKNNIPGAAVAITHNNKVIFTKGYGKTGDNTSVTAKTPFAIASLSKSFTALAVMQLVEAGKVKLDTPVEDYIPSFKLTDTKGAKITVRQLLNHTSGLTDKVYPDMTLNPQPNSLEAVIKRLENVSLAVEPGKEYHYNNPNYQILARLVEAVSNEEFSTYLENHIFQPLEMEQTFNVSTTMELNQNPEFPSGHYFLFGIPVAVDEPNWFISGPAGIVSNVNDMAKWLISQLNGGKYRNEQILSSESIKSMQTASSPTISYGMGWNIGKTEDGKKQVQHSGILWTYKAEEVLLPEQGYGIVMLFNSGLNAFVDYSSFTSGISKLLSNQTPNEPFYNSQMIEMFMVVLIIITIIIGIRKLKYIKKWEGKYKKRPKWRSIIYLIFSLLPLYILVFLPQLLTFIGGGRVLNIKGIFLMMPSIIIWLGITSILSLAIVIRCVIRIPKLKNSSQISNLKDKLF
ncbi:serine hydrolase domain-containing protein [Virgibacillus oceani]|uniref:Serine hydrolase n=1 Tax=Virgibacillus oceani TaxID=1479511 RepID=A0A917HCB6_9BACI|nr:serine hydrolase domain-containing protein [Virgibacillus oceani]GGG74327.1 serine hydrolase [Virgibacillus oceani]